jgi:hypothetical protein
MRRRVYSNTFAVPVRILFRLPSLTSTSSRRVHAMNGTPRSHGSFAATLLAPLCTHPRLCAVLHPAATPGAPSAHSSGRATSPSSASELPRRHLESSDQIVARLHCINLNQQPRWSVPSVQYAGSEFKSYPMRETTTFFLIFVSLTADS